MHSAGHISAILAGHTPLAPLPPVDHTLDCSSSLVVLAVPCPGLLGQALLSYPRYQRL